MMSYNTSPEKKKAGSKFILKNKALFLLAAVLAFCTWGCDITGDDSGSVAGEHQIVLLHGFLGWGRDEVGGSYGHYHWGGYDDLQEMLKSEGYATGTAVVGPFSSNWDRACELYAQLTGTRTDYGLAHSRANNHERFGRDFTDKAIVENWGPKQKRKISIIAHSQGGQTARMLAQLLENGHPDELKMHEDLSNNTAQCSADDCHPVSPLFSGSSETKDLIFSITTMATPHNGTTLANGIQNIVGEVEEILTNIIAMIGVDADNTIFNIYDFKLQQFGLQSRQPGEPLSDYIARMETALETFLSGNKKDTCLWDLSPEGAREQNEWIHAQKNIYYFSFSGKSSQKAEWPTAIDNWEYHQVTNSNVPLLLWPTTLIMGSYTCNDSRYQGVFSAKDYDFFNLPLIERPVIESSWWENDGVVNTISMNGPWLYPAGYSGTRDIISEWSRDTAPQKGVWNSSAVFTNLDHWDITGMELVESDRNNFVCPEFGSSAENWYIDWAGYLKNLK